MWDALFKIGIAVGGAVVTYVVADQGTKYLTGKHIHEHALDCLPVEFRNKIKAWCGQAIGGTKVCLQLLMDESGVHGKRALRAIGLWEDPFRAPVTITEEVISLEQALQLGFDLNVPENQEVELDMATMAA